MSLSGRMPAYHVQGPWFNPPKCKNKAKQKRSPRHGGSQLVFFLATFHTCCLKLLLGELNYKSSMTPLGEDPWKVIVPFFLLIFTLYSYVTISYNYEYNYMPSPVNLPRKSLKLEVVLRDS